LRNLKRLMVLALAVAMVFSLAACGPADTGTDPTDEPTEITIAMWNSPSGTFNPAVTESAYDTTITGLIYGTLLETSSDLGLSLEDAIATNYDIADDNLSVRFQIREGIKWHDGEEFTADDVRFTLAFFLHPDYPGAYKTNYAKTLGSGELVANQANIKSTIAAEVEAEVIAALENEGMTEPGEDATEEETAAWTEAYDEKYTPLFDERWGNAVPELVTEYEEWATNGDWFVTHSDYDFTIKFDTVDATNIQTVGWVSILPEHVWSDINMTEAKTTEENSSPIGLGPYMFDEFETDQYVVLKANPDYYLGEPSIDTVIFRVINQEVAVGMMEKGELDVVGVGAASVTPDDIELFEELGDAVTIFENPDWGYQHMYYNLKHEFLSIKEVRQALTHAINRQGMVDQLLQGHGTVMHTIFLDIMWAYDASKMNLYEFDPGKATEMLTAAGFADTDGDGWLDKDGKIFEVTLLYPGGTSNPVRQASAPLVQDNLADIGVKVNLEPADFNTIIAKIFNMGNEPDFDMGFLGWSLAIDPDPSGLFETDSPYNFARWSPETIGQDVYDEFLRLQNAALQTLDQDERAEYYSDLGALFNEWLPYTFLYTQNMITVMSNRIEGYNTDIRGAMDNIHEWKVVEGQ